MNFHVRVGLENVPLHAWNEHTVSRIIGRASSLDYIEPRSLRKEDTELLWVWVWAENPSCIPKIKRVTMPARNAVVSGGRSRGRRGLRYRVLIHLAQVEDFSSVDENGNPPPPYALPFKLGVVDGAEQQPRRNGSPRRINDRRGRRDDDERGGRDRSRGWRESLRRSLSRNTRRAPRDDSRGGRPDHGRYDSRDGGTRRTDSVVGAAGCSDGPCRCCG
jgi:hypothetical protein